MYTEEYENKGFPILKLIFKILLVIIFIFLLIWLIPKIIFNFKNKEDNNANKNNSKNQTTETVLSDCLTPQTYNKNIKQMKEAAIQYYTEERLPKKVGDNATMTLEEMLNKKLLLSLIDKNEKDVDIKNSYVNIIKLENEYVLKVSIKDSEKEDYILVHLGCYDYCEAFICEAQEDDTSFVPVKGYIENETFIVPVK